MRFATFFNAVTGGIHDFGKVLAIYLLYCVLGEMISFQNIKEYHMKSGYQQ
jgi:hypothetical protein